MSDAALADEVPRLAAVVCTRDRVEHLGNSLNSLGAALRDGDERIVVDSASEDAEAVVEVATACGFRVVRCDQPGLSRARNAGLRATRARYVAYTDDDCRAHPAWADTIVRALDSDERLGFVTGSVRADRDVRLPLAVSATNDRRSFARGDDPLQCGHGANIAFRRAALEAVGAFDEALGAGSRLRSAEDTDIFWRLLDAGWAGVHEPDACVTHIQWRSTAAALKISWGYGLGAGAVAAKGLRRRRTGARGIVARGLWGNGIARAWRDLRSGYQTGVASDLIRVAGFAIGIASGLVLRLRGERFR